MSEILCECCGREDDCIPRMLCAACHKNMTEIAECCTSAQELKNALKAWQLMDSESWDQCPIPDLALRATYRNNARKLTKIALKEK